MFKIKICGITRTEDVESIAASGADAIGLNLVAASPRCVGLEHARGLAKTARNVGLRVCVVVMDPALEELEQIVRTLGPDCVQLHGQEVPASVESIEKTSALKIVKALSWTGRQAEAELAGLWLAHSARVPLSFLVDAYAPVVGGGTGRIARWDLLNPKPIEFGDVPMLLAGGLNPQNVARAIHETNCTGVDTASGVETAPGIKSRELVESFVSAAKQAFVQLQRKAANAR